MSQSSFYLFLLHFISQPMHPNITPAHTNKHPKISIEENETVQKKVDEMEKDAERTQLGGDGGYLKPMVKAKHNTRKQGRSKVTDNKVTDNKKSTKAINQLFRPSEEQKLTLPERRKAGEKMGPPQLAAQKDDTTAATCPKYTPHNLDANDKVKHAKSSSWPLLRPASHARGHYKVYTEAQVDLFFALMKEQNLTARQAALAAEINPRTGQRWAQDAKEKSVDGRRPKHWEKRTKLHSEHGEFLDQLYESNPKTTARMAQEELCAQFEGLSITPNGVYKYMQRRKHIQSLV